MKQNLGNIWVELDNYEFVRELYFKAKQKNFSQTLNSILENYRNLSEQHQKAIERIRDLMKENQDLKQTAGAYRDQLVRP